MVQWFMGDDVYVGCGDGVEYYQCGVVEYWFRDMLDKVVYCWEQVEDDQYQGDYKVDVVVGDFGQLDYVVVLVEVGVWEGVEDCGNEGVQVVSQYVVFQVFYIQWI